MNGNQGWKLALLSATLAAVATPPLWGQLGKVPEGFTPIFNGVDLSGWHISKTNHHGTTPEFRVVHGIIVGTQNPRGRGGILLTDKKYKNVEVYMEIKPDWGCDSGLFLRSSEAGEAYQVTLDYLPGGSMGGIYGERLKGVSMGGAPPADLSPEKRAALMRQRNEAWQKAWKREEWNSLRARIEGAVPHVTVWINDQLITDWTDTANHAAGGAEDGMIAIQMHFSGEKTPRWADGGFWRWRIIAVRELPDTAAQAPRGQPTTNDTLKSSNRDKFAYLAVWSAGVNPQTAADFEKRNAAFLNNADTVNKLVKLFSINVGGEDSFYAGSKNLSEILNRLGIKNGAPLSEGVCAVAFPLTASKLQSRDRKERPGA